MKQILKIMGILIAALVIALASGWVAIFKLQSLSSVKNGVWQVNSVQGGMDANPYTKAYTAVKALFAMDKTETLYFDAYEDADGEVLNSACEYTLSGKAMDARWWSVTAYGAERYLILNPVNRYSFAGEELVTSGNSRFTIRLAASEKEGNWLPTGDEEKFSIMLRLYNPEAQVYQNLETYELPTLIKEGCR